MVKRLTHGAPSGGGHTCSKCGAGSTVYETRESETTVWRRRECRICHHRWTTYEAPQDLSKLILSVRESIVLATEQMQQASSDLRAAQKRMEALETRTWLWAGTPGVAK